MMAGVQSVYGGERLLPPDGLHYHRFASSVYGPEAVWINPAGLGDYKKISGQYMLEIKDGKLSKSWAACVTGDGIGISYRRLRDFMGGRLDEYIFGAGLAVTASIYTGISYRYISNGPSFYNNRHFWNLGLLIRPNPRFAYAIVLSNLNRGRIDGERTDFEQAYSFSFQTKDGRLVFSTEILLSAGQNLSDAVYNYGLDIFPRPDLSIYANLMSSDGFEIGLRWNLTRYFIGGQARYDDDREHLGTTFWGGYRSPRKSRF
jgi:hypothetical protein